MTSPTPIACDLHDHLEVACLFGYEVRVRYRDSREVIGRAATTRTDDDKNEHLILRTSAGQLEVPMHEIARVTVLTPGARFSVLDFT